MRKLHHILRENIRGRVCELVGDLFLVGVSHLFIRKTLRRQMKLLQGGLDLLLEADQSPNFRGVSSRWEGKHPPVGVVVRGRLGGDLSFS